MKKSINKRNHGKTIIMHLKRHHKKYFCGIFGGFAVVKMLLLFFGLSPVLNIGDIFASSDTPITLTKEYLDVHCPLDEEGIISCTGKNIGSIEPGTFSGMNINTLDLSYNKLSSLDFEVFTGSTITTLDVSNNQIYEIVNGDDSNGTNVIIEYNCLPNYMVTNMNITNGNTHQLACFYVEYQPATWTNGSVKATLSVTGKNDIVDDILSNVTSLPFTTFSNTGSKEINFDNKFLSYSGSILNYPADSQKFPAYVDWIDTINPTCSTNWTYEQSSVGINGWNNSVITGMLYDSTDEGGSEILTGGGSCTIEAGKNSTCTVTISDNAGNTTDCQSTSFNIDTQAPTITLNKQSGTASNSHSVVVTITDDVAGFEENSSIRYKWQTNGNSCDANNYNSNAVSNNEGDKTITTTISTSNLSEGEYYLCISGVQDRAGNSSESLISEGTFVVESNGHSSPENLVYFERQPNGNWVGHQQITIVRTNGATGCTRYSNSNHTFAGCDNGNYSGTHSFIIDDENHNNKYICAFWQSGTYTGFVCSQERIRVDTHNPKIELMGPTNGTSANLGDTITLSWSGRDDESGIDEYGLTIKKPNSIENFYYNSGVTSTGIIVDQVGTRKWSVTAYDKVRHEESSDEWSFDVENNGGGGDTPVPGELVSFGRQPNGNWIGEETIIIHWHEGATGGYRYQTSTGSREAGSYEQISSGSVTLNIRDENHNKYICAYGQTGGYTGFICSTYPVKVDVTNPNLSLDYPHPSVSYDFKKGTDIRFVWSGSDDKSGMSGYVFDVVSPSGLHDPHNFGPNTTEYTKNLNETGRRYWYVTGYDNLNHQTDKSGSFYVSDDGDVPENGFYLISPALGAQISLGNDVVLSWHPGTVNSGYNWTVKKISGTTIATGTTTGLTATVSGSEFTTGAYYWSVKDIATNVTKIIELFYVVDDSDAPDLKVNQFEFNEVENADLDEYYSSNRITIRGLSDDWFTFAYLGSGIGALNINGEFVGTYGYVQNGDKVYIEMKASDEYNKTVKTTLFVGMGSNTVSGDFKITTKDGIHDWDDPSLTPMQRLWGVLFVDNLVEMYQYDEKKLATFLSTFMQLLQDKSDYYASKIQEAEEDGDEDLVQEYKLYKEAIDFLYLTVKYRYNHLDIEDRTIYIAPNGKQYLIEYDEDRMAYTSPDFSRPKYFPTWELLTNHIDMNNPAVGKWGIVGNVITTHNGKVYTIYETNGKWTSSNFKTAKYFDTKEDIINHILANNPASDWDHRIDTDFDEVTYTAPNGKVYKIFKTSRNGNNPNMYSSYNFVNAKYFTSLEAAKKFIDQNNKK